MICNTNGENEKCIQEFGFETSMEGTTWET